MTVTTDAVVIGGGVMGTSILYNLAARGVTNPVLLERDTLGSGSTGRSSGLIRMHYSDRDQRPASPGRAPHLQELQGDRPAAPMSSSSRTGFMVFVPEDSIDGSSTT